jgi:DNA-binding NarL/FixJ family response regulator
VSERLIRLLLVDDHAAFRMPLALMLEREPDLTVVAQAGTSAEARALIRETAAQIHVALVDLHLPEGNGTVVLRELRKANPDSIAILLTADSDPYHHAQAIEAGAVGVISKSVEPAEIIAVIRRAYTGEPVQPATEIIALLRLASEERAQMQAVEALLARLTARERQVLALLTEGLDNKEIADRLFISAETARAHVVRVLAKLNVESRLQAAIFAIRHGVGPQA